MVSYIGDMKQVLFFCVDFLHTRKKVGRKIIIGGENRAYKDNFSVHRMQAAQLQHEEG